MHMADLRNCWQWLLVAVLLCAVAAEARQVTLTLTDGRHVSGEMVEQNADRIVLDIGGIRAIFEREQIADIQIQLTLAEQYRQRRAQLADDDFAARYDLARWLFDRNTAKGDALARQELQQLLEDRPEHGQARLLLQLVEQRIAEREAEAARPPQRPTRPDGAMPPDQPGPMIRPARPNLLTDEQCNILRVYEINLRTEPRVVIPQEVLRDFLDRYQASDALAPYRDRNGRRQFLRLSGYEQLQVIFQAQAREFYPYAVIRDEPEVLQTFRTQINPALIVGYCGRCHGEQGADGLRVFTRAPRNLSVAYTNFLILHRLSGGARKMIDRQLPEESLILQFGLPRQEAKYPHPDVEGWTPFFRAGVADPLFDQYRQWADSLYTPSPKYPVQYTLPRQGPPAEPEREPETAPAPNGNASPPPPATP